jgi:hypothetical protein
MSRCAVTKLVKDTVPVSLLHLRVDVVAGVPKLSNFFCKQLNSIHRVAKDDTLVDFKFGKECVKAMYLLSFFDVGVELGNTAKGKFVHEIDTVRFWDELLAKILDGDWEGCAEQADLMFLVAKVDNLFQDRLELGRKKLVRFIHHDRFDVAQIRNFFGREIKNTSWSCNYDVHSVVKTHNIVL